MSDLQQSQSRGEIANTTLDVILRMVAQNITPVIVSLLCTKLPILNEATWFQVTVFCLAGIGAAICKFTPDSIWDNIASLILFVRKGLKKVRAATDEPIDQSTKGE